MENLNAPKNTLPIETGYGEYLLLYTIDGKGVLRYNGKEYALTPQTVFIIDCDEYQYYGTEGEYWHFYYVHFLGASGKELLSLFSDDENYCAKVIDEASFTQTILDLMHYGTTSLPYDVLKSSILLNNLFLQLISEKNASPQPDNAYNVVRTALEMIKADYSKKLTLSDLAQRSFISKYHFLRLFYKITGMTPMDYLSSFRISKAKTLLQTTDLSIEQISASVGYENTSSFIRAFKKHTGITPRKFQAKKI